MNLDVALEEVLPHPIHAVWSALTDAPTISEWLMSTADFEPVVGARFRLKTQRLSANGWVDAQVIELDPPRRMVWAWTVNDGAWSTTVTVRADARGRWHPPEADACGRDRPDHRWPDERRLAGQGRVAEEVP